MDYKNSNIWQRLADFYLSCFFHFLVLVILILIFVQSGYIEFNIFAPEFWKLSLLIFIGFHLIETLIEGLSGAGIAKHILGMRLLDNLSYKPIGLIRAFLRSILAVFSFLLLGLGFFASGFNQEHKTLHDLLTNSRVVNTPKQGITKFVSIFWVSLSVFFGLTISLIILAMMTLFPVGITKSLINLNKTSSFDISKFNSDPKLKIILPYQQKRISALTELNNIEYIEYNLNPLNKYNFIQPETLKLLSARIIDYNYLLIDWEKNINNAKLKTAILIPKLTLKDQNDNDIVIYNQKFIIDPSNTSLGTDFLDLFDYQINNQTLLIAIHPEDQTILADYVLNTEEKNYLLYVLRQIRSKWQEYQRNFSAVELENFAQIDEKLTALIEIDFNTKNGYVSSGIILEPTKNEVFNQTCKKFIKEIPRFKNIPPSLANKNNYKLRLALTYRELFNRT